MITISASVFKAKCLEFMDGVVNNHEEYTITKRGVPIAKMVPIPVCGNPFGFLKNTVSYSNETDLYSTGEDWDAVL